MGQKMNKANFVSSKNHKISPFPRTEFITLLSRKQLWQINVTMFIRGDHAGHLPTQLLFPPGRDL